MTKPIAEMTTDEIVAALHACTCNHLISDHDVRGWCCKYQCPCRTYVDSTIDKCPNCGSAVDGEGVTNCAICLAAWGEG